MDHHRDWAQATRLTVQLFDPDHDEHPQLDEQQFGDPAANQPGWALSLDYGDGYFIIEGEPTEITTALESAADQVHRARNTAPLFNRGYWSAKRFYGPDTRAALDLIAAEIVDFRAAFPTLPAQVEQRIARIEQLAASQRADRPPALSVPAAILIDTP